MEPVSEHKSYLDTLNPEQLAAVEYCEGSQLVIAGAGSGKTRVLTCKIAYLIEQGLQPWSIMALTFTNKAAGEMRQRISSIVGDKAQALAMGTFHSVFARLLRYEAPLVGYTSNYTIYDDDDSRRVISNIVKEMNLDAALYKPSTVQNIISRAKNNVIDALAYAADEEQKSIDAEAGRPLVWSVYQKYTERCRRSNAMDFDDLLLLTYQLFEQHPEVRDKYASRYQYILVDEYQDTNYVQHLIVKQLASKHHRLCVVGDDAQSIYAFRGANIDNILELDESSAATKLFKLERNYRSTRYIVDAANSLIDKNKRQIKKRVVSQQSEGEPLLLIETATDIEESIVVRKEIQRLIRGENLGYADFAILYRTNAQSRKFEEEFRKYGLPYVIYGGLGFYQHKEIKDMIAYFRLAVNTSDDEAFRRVVNYPARGIGATTIQRLVELAEASQMSLFDTVMNVLPASTAVSSAARQRLMDFANMINDFASKVATLDASDLALDILNASGMRTVLSSDDSEEGKTRRSNVEELMGAISDFVSRQKEEDHADQLSLADYLQEVSLMTDADRKQSDTDCIRLMTVHAAKGLEFNTVFVVGLEERLFPSEQSYTSARALEEERRLFYVAITRAELHCILTYAQSRYMYGKSTFASPSRFINDIDPNLIRRRGYEYSSRPTVSRTTTSRRSIFGSYQPTATSFKPRSGLRSIASTSSKSEQSAPVTSITTSQGKLNVGTHIIHQRFGHADVTHIEGTGENAKITVRLANNETKQLLVRFAHFEIVSQ